MTTNYLTSRTNLIGKTIAGNVVEPEGEREYGLFRHLGLRFTDGSWTCFEALTNRFRIAREAADVPGPLRIAFGVMTQEEWEQELREAEENRTESEKAERRRQYEFLRREFEGERKP